MKKGSRRPEFSGANHPMFGKHHTEETRRQMSLSHMGKQSWNKGKHGLQSSWNKGKKGVMPTPWNKGKKGVMPTPWNKGLTISDPRVKKYTNLRILNGNHLRTQESKDKISKKNLGKHYSPSTEFKSGQKSWCEGLTKDNNESLKKISDSMKKNHWMDKLSAKERSDYGRAMRMSQNFPKKFTKIERMIFKGLEDNKIPFVSHKFILGVTEADAFIEPNIIIYCDGDYWHCNPNKFNRFNADTIQKEKMIRDERNNIILKEHGYKVLRFWESDIKKDLQSCIVDIKNAIKLNDINEGV